MPAEGAIVSTTTRMSSTSRWSSVRVLVVIAAAIAGLAGCTDDPAASGPDAAAAPTSCAPAKVPEAIDPNAVSNGDWAGTTIRLATHDSFALSDGTLEAFTAETGIKVEVLPSGDAGTMVSQAVLTAGNPVADVLYGIDNTFLCRGTRAGVFVPYASTALADVDDGYELDPDHLVTPIDVGDVCLNYSRRAFPGDKAPTSLDDLRDPALADAFVTENPESSSPGLAFLLATVAAYGEDGWEDYWADLRSNGVLVVPGWEEAYEGKFKGGSGDRSIVTSYASSPVADVLYSDPPRDKPAIGVIADACFRQVEFAGVLAGTEHPEAAARLVDFMLSRRFQEDLPLNMFVEPVNARAVVPAEFKAHRTVVSNPLTLNPAEIEAGRDRWTERWTEIVLR